MRKMVFTILLAIIGIACISPQEISTSLGANTHRQESIFGDSKIQFVFYPRTRTPSFKSDSVSGKSETTNAATVIPLIGFGTAAVLAVAGFILWITGVCDKQTCDGMLEGAFGVLLLSIVSSFQANSK
jgi:hypothetical protein